ncbi:hypothetical protein K227x_29910 [Rubripirellula lacrimiformis]|uniref:Membrane protein containing DUF1355 n=1 Tax=Rubripirellula lacrimiformis TaxID=1930273 RepID=A0A517NC55_9BACT|nr:hypothetical protein [Rubripirellula lacrimiformis]QDT04598.1 hypothetical protein K227x_29910 [Rubripirellula lacrimiformis]
MTPTQTATTQQLLFDGPWSVSSTVLIGLAIAALFAWSLYRERRVLGASTTLTFASLRLIALAGILWMLLAPATVVVQTASTRRTVAFVADASASMETVDPIGTADDSRWNIRSDMGMASEAPGSTTPALASPSVAADGAFTALGVGLNRLSDSIRSIQEHHSQDAIYESLETTLRSIQHAQSGLETVVDQLSSIPSTSQNPAAGSSSLDKPVEAIASDALRILRGPEFEEFAEITTLLSKGKSPSDHGWQSGLRDLQHKMISAREAIGHLAARLAILPSENPMDQNGRSPITADQTESGAFAKLSRSQRVDRVLHSLRETTLADLNEVDVQWGRFDSSYRSVHSDSRSLSTTGVANVPAEPAPGSMATDLTSVLTHLRKLQQQQPIAAAFIYSDVAHNGTSKEAIDRFAADPNESSDEEKAPDASDSTRSQSQSGDTASLMQLATTLTDTPIFIVPIGNPNRLRDIHLVSVESPSVAMRNDDIVIEAHLEAYQCDGERCTVQLLRDGAVVDFREVAIEGDFASRSVRFDQTVSYIGKQTFEVAIAPIEFETSEENNADIVDINVTRSDIKVLLADEMPRWEFRYLAQLFRRDSKIDCDEMLFRPRMIATGKREPSQSFPTTVDQWDQYDVVILGDIAPEHLPVAAQESLLQFLSQRGGTLITIAGQRAMPSAFMDQPLSEVIPVTRIDNTAEPQSGSSDRPQEFAFRATELGRSHVALMIGETQQATRLAWDFVNRFSPVYEVSPYRRPKPSAHNLISVVQRSSADTIDDVAQSSEATEDTFLCWQPVGRGRMVYLSGPDTYRLRFLRGDQLHYRFWGQLLRWAIASDLAGGSRTVRLRTSKSKYQPNEPVRVEVQLSNTVGEPVVGAQEVDLTLTSGSSKRTVRMIPDDALPGTYVAETSFNQPGSYIAEPTGPVVSELRQSDEVENDRAPAVSFTVQAEVPTELIDTRCNRALAQQIAELTGGQVLAPSAVAEVLSLLNLQPEVVESTQRTPLWAQWKYLWLVFGCLQVEWIVRKWRGLS